MLYQLSYCRISVAQEVNDRVQFSIAGAKVLLFLELASVFRLFFRLSRVFLVLCPFTSQCPSIFSERIIPPTIVIISPFHNHQAVPAPHILHMLRVDVKKEIKSLYRIVNLAKRRRSCLVPTLSNLTVALASMPLPERAMTSPRPKRACSM